MVNPEPPLEEVEVLLWHGYLAAENLGLNTAQKKEFMESIEGLGQENASHRKLQVRVRLDNNATIFEAVFLKERLTPAWFKQYLAKIFGIPNPNSITHTVGTAGFGDGTTQYVDFSRLGVTYLRIAAFGGVELTGEEGWIHSNQECRGYLDHHWDEWNALIE